MESSRQWFALAHPTGYGGNLLGLSDVTGLVARSDKLVNRAEQLLGGEVYHYHTKFIMKEAHTGGSFVWYACVEQPGVK